MMEETMRTETDEIRDNLKYLALLARDYPWQRPVRSSAHRRCSSCPRERSTS